MNSPTRVVILGGSGYGGGELLRLLTQHPSAEVVAVTSATQVGTPVAAAHPHLRGFYDLQLCGQVPLATWLRGEKAVVISALPHGRSAAALAALLHEVYDQAGSDTSRRVRAIDLSGDLRLRDADLHTRYYPDTPVWPEYRAAAAYGLTELNREAIRSARIVANPGCLATAAILAGAPVVCDESFQGAVAIDAKTGSSGAGRQLKESTHHSTRHGDFRAYKPLAHQHEPEILQAWKDPSGQRLQTSFVSQGMDVARGIFATLHLTLPEPTTTEALAERYREFYSGHPFVRVVRESPTLQDVVGSNFCDLSVVARGRQVIVMAALDNLVKGMAGAAIQNMNLMCGLPETTGLWTPALRLV